MASKLPTRSGRETRGAARLVPRGVAKLSVLSVLAAESGVRAPDPAARKRPGSARPLWLPRFRFDRERGSLRLDEVGVEDAAAGQPPADLRRHVAARGRGRGVVGGGDLLVDPLDGLAGR